jgi:aspartyl-tRNA(Asn)/glutamyl-tRNA(Gln) amidotransferase subunit C
MHLSSTGGKKEPDILGIRRPDRSNFRNSAKPGVSAYRNLPNMTAKVTTEDVERVAELAHLKLTPDETGNMVHDLNAMLDYVAQLNELDTTSVLPLAQVSELEGAGGAGSLREDLVKPSLSRAEVMAQAPETDNAFFKVPKVIER